MTEVQSIIKPELNSLIDKIEDFMVNDMVASGEFEILEAPVKHTFTKGMYAREITMKPGMRITSKIHLTDHQFIISQGVAVVYDGESSQVLVAPYHGVTKAGTRRVLMIPDESPVDCIWTTFHPAVEGESTVEQIEERIIEKHTNRLLTN